jgi:SAM-dependent methyltransferase
MPESAYQLADQQRMRQARNYFAWQARLVRPEIGSRVLEYGCGIGNFTAHLLDRELLVACDPDSAIIANLQVRYPDRANLRAFEGTSEHPSFTELATLRLDSCVCLNVLEHVEDDRAALAAIASVLSPKSTIVLLVPAFPALYGSIDRELRHFRRYTRRGVMALTEACKLKIRKLHFVNAVGFFGWWVNGRILRREAQSSAQIAVFDRLIVPIESRLERILPPPFGQSLFAVLEKW